MRKGTKRITVVVTAQSCYRLPPPSRIWPATTASGASSTSSCGSTSSPCGAATQRRSQTKEKDHAENGADTDIPQKRPDEAVPSGP